VNAQLNPYQAPQSRVVDEEQHALEPAERWRRFLNLILDYFGLFALSFLIGIAFALIGGQAGVAWLQKAGPQYLVGFGAMLLYYIPLEAAFGRTLGKLITGTKVVNEAGGTPTFGQIVGRTLCRFIPFEAFSFLSQEARGWHDSIPKTYVVKTR